MSLGETFLVGRERHEGGGATAQRLERRRTMGNEVASAKRALGEASRTAGALRARSATGLRAPGPGAAAALPVLDEKAAGTRARIGKGPLCRGTAPELHSADRGSQTQRHSAPAGNVATASKEEEGEGEGQPCTRHGSSLGATRSTPGGDALVCQRKLELRIFT